MLSLAKFSIKRPKAALAGWLIAGIALSLIGFGVAHSLSPSVTVVPGTESARAQKLANAQFGPTQLVPILLEGPKAQLNKTGPKLVVALTKRPHTRVLSAWDAGTASTGLRPSPTAAMIVASVDRSERNVVQYDQPQIEKLVSKQLAGTQIKSYISGQPSIDRALKDASLNNLRSTELIAIGVLFLLLLVGLRAPLAALLVTAVGAISTLAAFGEVAVLGKVMHLDPVGVALGTMTGLALGVGFSLLILDRFHREELPDGMPARNAVVAALTDLETTGRAVLIGGSAIALALGIVAITGPSELMISLGTGMLTCALFATGGAVAVMPAALVLFGRRLDAFSFPAPAPLRTAWSRMVEGGNFVTRHAVYLGFATTAVLAAIAVPAFALNTSAPSVTQLPKDSKARIAFTEISRVMGPGWATPFNMIVVANKGAITDPAMLAAVNRLQLQIAHDPRVSSVTGPGTINATSQELKKFGPSLVKSAKLSDKSKKDLLKLIDGLGQAGSGSAQLKAGLQQAVSGANQLNGGAGQLNAGAGQAAAGAGQIHSGSSQLYAGSSQLSGGLNQALSGANALKTGSAEALSGAEQLVAGLDEAHTGAGEAVFALSGIATLTQTASGQAATARSSTATASRAVASAQGALSAMTTGKKDPHYGALASLLNTAAGEASKAAKDADLAAGTVSQTNSLAAAVKSKAPALVSGLQRLHDGAAQLGAGISQLHSGNAQLAGGVGQLAGGGQQLRAGLGQLTAGAGDLQTGLGQLASGTAQLLTGTGQLATGLAAAPNGAGQLQTGLGQMQAGVIKSRGAIPSTKDLWKLFRESPRMFSSGYFVLAAVEGARGADRNAATFAVNLDRGGSAGQIVIISKYSVNDPKTDALASHLANLGQAFGKSNNAQVAIGGPGGSLGDLTSVAKSKIWLDVAVLAAALMIVMMIAVRAILLPAVATIFSLLVAGSTFGLMQILFGGSNPLLGGPGYLDPMSVIGIFTVVFSVSVTFATLLLLRTREAYMADTDGRSAVRVGLRQTAAATTGAGLVMVAALIPFATSELINIRQFGVGVAIAILLEILIVRPVLLPAAESVLGRFGWWPTRGIQPPSPPARPRTRRLPRLHLPHPATHH
jgi:putative drug exporter of the RND superfamily